MCHSLKCHKTGLENMKKAASRHEGDSLMSSPFHVMTRIEVASSTYETDQGGSDKDEGFIKVYVTIEDILHTERLLNLS